MIVTFECDRYPGGLSLMRLIVYLGQRSFHSKLIVWTVNTPTHTHTPDQSLYLATEVIGSMFTVQSPHGEEKHWWRPIANEISRC